jgi:hypothetical protein
MIWYDYLGLKARIITDKDACTITILLNIKIYPSKGDNAAKNNLEETAKQITKSIEDEWNGKKKGCCKVNVDANVTTDTKKRWFPGQSGDNQIEITSDSDHRSYVTWKGNGGKWSGGDGSWVFAHEAGHLMGLPDDYSDQEDGTSKANDGHEGHMMGEHGGKVNQHEIDDALGKTKCPCDKE